MTFFKSHDIKVKTLVFRPTKQISWHSASNVMTLITWHWGVDILLKVNFWWRWRKIITTTFLFNQDVSSLLETQSEALENHSHGNLSTPTCDVTMHEMVVPYSNNLCENSLVQWNVWVHRVTRENVSTMSSALVGRNCSQLCWHFADIHAVPM